MKNINFNNSVAVILLLTFLNLNSLSAFAYKNLNENKLGFIQNIGQVVNQNKNIRNDIHFKLSANKNINVFIGRGKLEYLFNKLNANKTVEFNRIDVELIGYNPNAELIALNEDEYYENYFCDWTGEKGKTAKSFQKIIYKNIYNKIDWLIYIKNNELKHEFIVHKGGNYNDITFKYSGIENLKLNSNGNLIASTKLGVINENPPISFNSENKIIPSSYLLQNNILKYKVENNDGDIIIDPTLSWSTYVGGNDVDYCGTVTNDNLGNIFMVGSSSSIANIATTGAYQTIFAGGNMDCFIAKFNSSGSKLWATYFGGSSDESPGASCIDYNGNICLTGQTTSQNGIATTGAFQTSIPTGQTTTFLCKFSTLGLRIWSTYFPAQGGQAINVDANNNIIFGGWTSYNSNLPTIGAFKTSMASQDNADGFLAKFNSTGNRIWSTFYGGKYMDDIKALTIDTSGNIIVFGGTGSDTGIATPSSFKSSYVGTPFTTQNESFIAKFNANGSRLWGTYFGGSNDDNIFAATSDKAGNIYFTGATNSLNNIATSGAYKPTFTDSVDVFLSKFNGAGNIVWSTYYGGYGREYPSWQSIKLDKIGNIFVSGQTTSSSNIATNGAYQTSILGYDSDAFLSEFSNSGNLIYGTYFGGTGQDIGRSVAIDTNSNSIYLSGYTNSSSGISTVGSNQQIYGGNQDAFLTKFNFCSTVSAGTLSGPDTVCIGKSITITSTVNGGIWYTKNGKSSVISGVVSGISNGIDTIYYALNTNCGNDTVKKVIFIKSLPSQSAITGIDSVCIGSKVTLSASISGGIWSSALGKTQVTSAGVVTGMSLGIDTILYTTSNSCGNTISRKIIRVITCNSESINLIHDDRLAIYPNPTTGKITIEYPLKDIKVVFFNIYGQQILESNSKIVDISSFSDGIYIMKIYDSNIQLIGCEKITKQ